MPPLYLCCSTIPRMSPARRLVLKRVSPIVNISCSRLMQLVMSASIFTRLLILPFPDLHLRQVQRLHGPSRYLGRDKRRCAAHGQDSSRGEETIEEAGFSYGLPLMHKAGGQAIWSLDKTVVLQEASEAAPFDQGIIVAQGGRCARGGGGVPLIGRSYIPPQLRLTRCPVHELK